MRGRFGWRKTGLAVAVALIAAACASLEWQPLGPHRSAEVLGAESAGAEECSVCHSDVQGHERIADYHADCESCHGGGSLHSDSEAVADIRFPANDDCLACHAPGQDTHLQWGTGEHSRAGLYCSDCHNPHDTTRNHLRSARRAGDRDMDDASQLCAACHPSVDTRFKFPSHHPVHEGGMSCMDCHDPHEDTRIARGAPTMVCAGCHQDYMGPYIYDHPPVLEDCGNCHDPHGAVTQNLLQTVQPLICLSCHPLNDANHHEAAATGIVSNRTISEDFPSSPNEQIQTNEAGTFLRRCTDCHGAIHGSHNDPRLFF